MATPREQLAHALKQARLDAGFSSHAKLARVLNVSRPVVSRAERPNEPVPSPGLIASWVKATRADLATLNDYAERARSPRNWFAKWAEDFEQRATLIRWFECLLIPGLLQTEAYARAVLSWRPDSARTETNLKSRVERQSVLDRAELRVLLLESVLYREVGSPQIMAEQVERLLTMIGRPSITVQIVPDSPEVAGALGGAFAVATVDAVDVAVYTESIVQGSVLTDPELIARAVRQFDGLHAFALPWSQTREQLDQAGEKWKQQI